MSIRVIGSQYAQFDCIRISWGDYEMEIAPEIGGRVLGLSYRGVQVLYAMPELMGKRFRLEPLPDGGVSALRRALGMKLYGGFKTWLAPQSRWVDSPYVDLDLAPYACNVETESGSCRVHLRSPVCRETGIRLDREIVIHDGDGDIEVRMSMKNCGGKTTCYGLWDVTQVNSPGEVYVPVQPSHPLKSFRQDLPMPLCVENIDAHVARVEIESVPGDWFKVGTPYSEGWVLSVFRGRGEPVGYLKRFPVYAPPFGHGCSIEVYNSNRYPYYECEVHGPVCELRPNDEFTMTQVWSVFSWDEQVDGRAVRDRLGC